MVGPLARITPTRLPWWWTLLAMWIVWATLSPALAAETEPPAAAREPSPAADVAPIGPLSLGSWQLVPMDLALRQLVQRDPTLPRMLLLAMLPMPRSTWWLGLGASRDAGARLELRWTMPLDGSAPSFAALTP